MLKRKATRHTRMDSHSESFFNSRDGRIVAVQASLRRQARHQERTRIGGSK